MTIKEAIIKNYIQSYNSFDIEGMLVDMDNSVVFENVSQGEVNMTLNGIAAFKAQAMQAAKLFSHRRQTINYIEHIANDTRVMLDYFAVLAVDLPNGMKRGDELKLHGTSIFTFANDKIVKLRDEG